MKKVLFFICLIEFTFYTNAQSLDSLKPNKKPIKTYFFKKNLTVRNFMLSIKYGLNKKLKLRKRFEEKWCLTFEDNFDSLNTQKWRIGQAWGEFHPNHLHQYYSKADVKVSNGNLYLLGSYAPKQFKIGDSIITIPYSVGLINSDISFKQKYGYFSIRCKNPSGAATIPAFWLTGATKWPPEIDIFEMYGRKGKGHIHNQYSTVHWGKNDTRSRGFLTRKINLPNNTDTTFHEYACEWTPKYIKFYTDGRLINYFRINKNMRKWLNEEMVVIINNCFAKEYLSYLNPKFKSNVMVVDWVRVYKPRIKN